MGGNEIVIAKKLKLEEKQMVEESRGEGQRDTLPEDSLEQGDALTKTDQLQEHGLQNDMVKAADTQNQDLTFRVSCRCSGNIGKAFPPQVRSPSRWSSTSQSTPLTAEIHGPDG